MRLRPVIVGLSSSMAVSLLPTIAMAAVLAPQKLLASADSQMKWANCGKNCVQGIDSIDSISAVIRGSTLILGEQLSQTDSKSILEEDSALLSMAVKNYGGPKALVWAVQEMKVWVSSSAPFEASEKFNGNTFTFDGWSGDASVALAVTFG